MKSNQGLKKHSNILVIGATNRNLGKTEFICRIIRRFSKDSITAIKIKTLYPEGKKYHGKDLDPDVKFLIRKEDSDGLEDSQRFISAGAQAVYYIKSPIEMLNDALESLINQQKLNGLILIESNSILEYIEPAGFILIKGFESSTYKPSSIKFFSRANQLIISDGNAFDLDPELINLRIQGSKWELS